MATTISKLAILLSLNSQGVTSGVADATKRVDLFDKKIGGIGSKSFAMLETKASSALTGIGKQFLASLAAAVAFERVVGGIADAYDRVATRSRRASQLGATVNELGALEFAFGQGTQINADGTFDALRAFNKRISDAKDPANELARALDRIGLSAQQLERLSVTERVRTIGEAIRQLPAAEDRAAVAAKFFEETGSNIVALFNEGDSAFMAFLADYKMLRGELNPAEVERMRDATQAMSRLWTSIEGSFERLASDLGPAVVGIFDRLTTLSIALRGIAKEDGDKPSMALQAAFASVNLPLFAMNAFSLIKPTSAPDIPMPGALPEVGVSGALDAEQDRLEEMDRIVAELNAKQDAAMEKLKSDSEALRLSLRTPIEEAIDALERLNELKAFGRLTEETQARAAESIWEKAKAQLLKDNKLEIKPFVDPSAALAERGTAAAFSAERQAQNVQKEMLAQQKAQLEEAERQTRLLEDLKTAFKAAGVTVRNNSI